MMPAPMAPGVSGALAGRGTRFAARLLDGFVVAPVTVVAYVATWALIVGVAGAGLDGSIQGYDDFGNPIYADSAIGGVVLAVFFGWLVAALLAGAAGNAVLAALTARKSHRNGQTLGKQVLDIRVVLASGAPVPTKTAWMREVAWPFLLALTVIGSFVDILWPLFDTQKRRLVDLACGTVVVIAPSAQAPPPPGTYGP